MLPGVDHHSEETTKRRPFEFITNIFKRRKDNDEVEEEESVSSLHSLHSHNTGRPTYHILWLS